MSENKNSSKSRFRATPLILLISLSTVAVALSSSPVVNGSSFAFTSYELGRSNYIPLPSPPDVCPTGSPNCWNWNAEPNIASAPDGSVYVSSENAAFNHLNNPAEGCNKVGKALYTCGGTGAWKSTNGGNSFTSLVSPNTRYIDNNSYTTWGGDTHIAVASQKNLNGYYNIYVVSLQVYLAGVTLSVSQDGGKTWSNNPTGITVPNPGAWVPADGNDRPWVAAYGAYGVCIADHDFAGVPPVNPVTGLPTIDVWCSADGGLTFTQVSSAIDANHWWVIGDNFLGNLAIDQSNGYMYQIFSGVANQAEGVVDIPCPITNPCTYGFNAVFVGVSTNGGLTFTDYQIVQNLTNPGMFYTSQFPNIAVDRAGNVYAAFSDGFNLWYSFSTDHGQTWSGPFKLNQSPSTIAIEPWLAAGDPGKVDAVWYGTGNCGAKITDVNKCLNSATWSVYMSQNLHATTNPTGFTQVQVTGTIHTGPVCTGGSGCQSFRGLFDDFGITASQITGQATIVYDNDMYTPLNQQNLPNPDCKSQYSTPTDPAQQFCVHTNIAHQTSGPGIYRRHSFRIDSEQLREEADGQHADYGSSISNDGDASITSFSVSVAGTTIPVTWNSAFPLQPTSRVSGSSVLSLESLLLLVGNAYPVTTTATFDDGATVTNSTSIVLTLP